MKTKPLISLCAISVILILVRLKTDAQPVQIEPTTTNCSADAIKAVSDVTVRSVLSARCANAKIK